MKSFATLFAVSAALAGLVAAQPSLQSRTSCKSNEFWYGKLSCCLSHGGPPTPPTPPRSRDCPKDSWYWDNHQGCCVPRHPSPPEPTCKPGFNWSKGSWCCEENPTPPSPPNPHPSNTYGGGNGGYGNGGNGGYGNGGYGNGGNGGYGNGGNGGYGNGGGHYGGHKKRHNTKRANTLCPTGLSACPLDASKGLNLSNSSDYHCVDPLEDLHACGGCAATGEGQDCSTIAHSQNVGCVSGRCEVFTCTLGYKISYDGKTCLKL